MYIILHEIKLRKVITAGHSAEMEWAIPGPLAGSGPLKVLQIFNTALASISDLSFYILVTTYLICSIMTRGHYEKIRSGPRLLKGCP
jgi:hypothetical protein